ncbi:MAG: S26 family signal peptidase [Bacteroidaceae bacterium]
MKKGRTFLSAFVITALVTWLLWAGLLVQFTVSTGENAPALYAGDRVLVSRLSYGWRPQLPFGFGSFCLGYKSPQRGQWMAFRNPTGGSIDCHQRGVLLGQCRALPGDTVWVSWDGVVVDPQIQTNKAYPFVVPGRKVKVEVKPWNARLLCRTLNKHEHIPAVLVGDTAILVAGKWRRTLTFTKDYFWIGSHRALADCDTRNLGYLPDDHLLGRVVRLSYSVDPEAPFYACFRGSRFFRSVDHSLTLNN